MNIYLDDIRIPKMSHMGNKGLGDLDFEIIRDDVGFIDVVINNIDKINVISFDHDLGIFRSDYARGHEFTGKVACDLMIDVCMDRGIKFPNWYVHSDNINGRENIIKTIVGYMKNIENIDVSNFRYFHRGYMNGLFLA